MKAIKKINKEDSNGYRIYYDVYIGKERIAEISQTENYDESDKKIIENFLVWDICAMQRFLNVELTSGYSNKAEFKNHSIEGEMTAQYVVDEINSYLSGKNN